VLPDEVQALLEGRPVAGAWDPVIPLLTTDSDGLPRVCLLSRAELDADQVVVRCAVRSRRTSANLRRRGPAALLVVGATTSYTVRARVARIVDDDGGLAAELVVTEVETDTLGIPLRPMSFQVDEGIARAERWDDNEALFARLNTPRTAPAVPTKEAWS
jgi:hypothetical protein